jgi:hypothetical protein
VGSKTSGTWYRGTVTEVNSGFPGQRDFNPWECITVEWDGDDSKWARRAARLGALALCP